MRFPYQKIIIKDSKKGVHFAYRPLIPLEISCNGEKLITYALVDSGADVCLFGEDLCRKLGVVMKSGKKQSLQGVGKGKVLFYLHQIRLGIGQEKVKTEVGFSGQMKHIPFAILGQKGFFENFLVAFNYPKKWIEVVKA